MLARILSVSALAVMISACTTAQENPNYQYSTKYKGSSPYQGQTVTQPVSVTQAATPVSYRSATVTSPTYDQCVQANMNRQLIGAGVGGAAGAIAGDKIAGGTTGTVIGAVVGGAAGYAVGDATKQCEHLRAQPMTHGSSNYGTASYSTYGQTAHGQTAYGQTAQSYPATTVTTPSNTLAEASTYSEPQTYSQSVGSSQYESEPVQTIQAPTDQAYTEDTYGTPGYHAVMAAEQAETTGTAGFGYTQAPAATVQAQSPVGSATQDLGQTIQYGQTLHEVVENDTVYSLSRRLCVGVEDIQTLNGLDAAFSIKLGDTIRLPESRC